MATTYVKYHEINDTWTSQWVDSYTFNGDSPTDIPLVVGQPIALTGNTVDFDPAGGRDVTFNILGPIQSGSSDYPNAVGVQFNAATSSVTGTLHCEVAVVWSTVDA